MVYDHIAQVLASVDLILNVCDLRVEGAVGALVLRCCHVEELTG